ncbi:MAG: biopolymer transporter ExbD [Pseudomonadota bacterium]
MKVGATRKSRQPGLTPMIDVVFLLLIFFLMTAQITPPEPFEIEVPASASEEPAETGVVLYLSAQGEIAFEDARGEAALAAVRALGAEIDVLNVRADRRVDAAAVAALLSQLSGTGVGSVELVSTGQ